MTDSEEPTLEQFKEAYNELIRSLQAILHQEAIFQDNVIAGVKMMASKLSDNRQHTMWAVEEISKLRKRVYMLETGLDASIVELRIAKTHPETVKHYMRLKADNMLAQFTKEELSGD